MSRDEFGINRRSVLKRVGAVAASGAALAGAASGQADARRLEAQYDDPVRLSNAFDEHAADLPAALVEAGVVREAFDFEGLDFEVDSGVNGLEPADADGVAGVTTAPIEGSPTALGMVSTSSDTHEISLFVQPEYDKSYAIVESKSDGDQLLISDDGDVTPLGCTYTTCGDYECYPGSWPNCPETTWVCDHNCQNCEAYETECECYC